MPGPKSFNIAIIGGGISGLCLALSLLDKNVPITIYEAAASFGEIGAGVSFGPNAARAMQMIHPEIKEAFEKCKTENVLESKRNTFFTCRIGDARKGDDQGFVRPGKKVGDALFDVNYPEGTGGGGVYRARFLDELVKSIPDGVARFGKKLVGISTATDGSGDKILHFEDGTTAQHNAVVGCDGIKSVARREVLGASNPAVSPVFSGKYAYRGLIPMDKAVALLGEEEAQNAQMYFGYHGHMLTFPIEKGKTMNGNSLEYALAVSCSAANTISVVAFNSKDTWDHPNWVIRTTKQEMVDDYKGWGPTVQSIIREMQAPDIWALFYHLPADVFYKDRVCLLGDAAHGTTPHQGAGAGMCIEDVLVLGNLLGQVENVNSIEKAFSVYDQVRRPRTLRNVKTSKEAGMLYDFELLGDDLDKIEKDFTSRMNWIWVHDLEAEVKYASVSLMELKHKTGKI
jgi:salicylate hydroxylase